MQKRVSKQKSRNTPLTSSERRFGVLLEDMNGKIDLVLEGHSVLDHKIINLDHKIDNVDGKIGNLDHKIDNVDKKLEDFRAEVNYKFDVVFEELHVIRNDLKEKVGRDEFQLLEKRVITLEKKFARTA